MTRFRCLSAFIALFSCALHINVNAEEWQQIPVPATVEIINDEGQPQTLSPACALETITDPATGAVIPNDFHFYFKPGNAGKLVVFFNGGGACWNDATCVTSLALSGVPGGRPTYNPSMYTENSPVDAGGIFDDDNPRNPFSNWSKVFIPYCTGDIHIGSNDVIYEDTTGIITGVPAAPVPVRHRGFDNFMAVREWLKDYYAHSTVKPRRMLVAGSSAGGYGATINFPYLQAAFPRARTALLSDGAAGVLSAGFVESTFSFGHTWGVENSLAPMFAQFMGAYQAATLNQDMMGVLAASYPQVRFAQYSTQLDAVQVLFYKISSEIDAGNMDPFTWGLTEDDYLLFMEWSAAMTGSYTFLNEYVPNYQYFIGAGDAHTVLTNTYLTAPGENPFYDERAGRMRFTRWLHQFANRWQFRKTSVIDQ